MFIRRHSFRSQLAAGATVVAFVMSSCGGDDGGGTAESWCGFVGEADAMEEIFDSFSIDPVETERLIDEVDALVKRLPDEAPSEIRDDAKTLADGMQQLVGALADADYNIADADLSFMADPELEAKLDQAGDNIDAYTEQECGRPFGSSSDSSDGDDSDSDDSDDADDSDAFDPANGTLREQLVTQFESIGLTTAEATCIADNIDFGDPAVASGDIASMLDVFGECGIGLDRLADLGAG